MQKLFEPSFIKLLKKGDRQAITDWYDQSAPSLLGVCMRYGTSTQDAEDLLHNGMLKILEGLSRFNYQGPGRFEAWMKRIIVNTALNHLRAESKIKNLRFEEEIHGNALTDTPDEVDELPPAPEPEELIEWIRQLPLGYRTVLNLYVFEGYTHKEIADELNISENTSKSQLSKARVLLRKRASGKLVNLELQKNG